jgi:SAM-dependent methyltransferase
MSSFWRHQERGDPLSDPSVPQFIRDESLLRYRFASGLAAGKKVLDIGCGYGYGSYILSLRASAVTGVDEDWEAVRKAIRRYRRPNLNFVPQSSLEFLSNTERRFDLITMFEVIEHVENHILFLQAASLALNAGGRLILSTPNRRFTPVYRRNPYHKREFVLKELMSIAENIPSMTVESVMGQIPGPIVLVPLPYDFIARLVDFMPFSERLTSFNSHPSNSRRLVLVLRKESRSGIA